MIHASLVKTGEERDPVKPSDPCRAAFLLIERDDS
jgi:hypothetical protein